MATNREAIDVLTRALVQLFRAAHDAGWPVGDVAFDEAEQALLQLAADHMSDDRGAD